MRQTGAGSARIAGIAATVRVASAAAAEASAPESMPTSKSNRRFGLRV